MTKVFEISFFFNKYYRHPYLSIREVVEVLFKDENLDFVVIYKPVYEQFVEFLKPMDFSIAFKRMP